MTVALANRPAKEHEIIEDACELLADIGCSAVVGVSQTPDDVVYLAAIVTVGDDGRFRVSTEAEARAGEALPRQALSMAHKIRELAKDLIY